MKNIMIILSIIIANLFGFFYNKSLLSKSRDLKTFCSAREVNKNIF